MGTKSNITEPFRKLLSKNAEFAWTPELQGAFLRAREEIVALVQHGVKSFRLGAHTCLITDWSKQGVGYVLWQKHCKCSTIHPTCCKTGWAMIICGSRYCTPAETRYHPIEGELLAVVWALEKTKQYTLGCERLLVLVDHKPLLGLLTRRELGDIDNPRLEHLAERLQWWNFDIHHIAGAKNFAPDAFSRTLGPHPAVAVVGALGAPDDAVEQWSASLEAQVLATTVTRTNLVVSWDLVRNAGIVDGSYASLLHAVTGSGGDSAWTGLEEYRRYAKEFTTVDGVVLFRGRVVIPTALRRQVLQALHRAHQGVTGMNLRAQDSVWWPGCSRDIEAVRGGCMTCARNAPSQSATPPITPPVPQYPFQYVSSDYFAYAGVNYLVFVDRYSGWPSVYRCKDGTAAELVKVLREYFCTWGALEELATDGGATYMAASTQRFLADWVVRHRVSSAYNPHSNLRAESAVKTVKRLIARNVDPRRTLDTDALAMALLQHRNTPDRDTGRSPAQVLFSRKLQDAIPVRPEDLKLRPEWVLTSEARERALARRHAVRC